ncbi:DUF1275 family protein [Streptomyces sp. NPDC013457]|uniref:DUF1275 family protein n=1 Tax=Streptomyces sp. NPDC013457 TaxID=3364866 RepID=UPI0036F7AB65
MRKLLADVAHTLVPPTGDRHGPLPPLMLTLTVVAGLVDAVSFLALGQVFVANMTGNVVLLGFAVAGAAGFSAPASLTALASFLVGAVGGGRLGTRFAAHRGRLLGAGVAGQALLVAAALATAATSGDEVGAPVRYTLIVALGIAMGLQTAVVRRVAVPGLTTTVLTQTLTGLAADSTAAGRAAPRRALSVLAMFLGALAGALLLQVRLALALGVTLALLVGVHLAVRRLSATDTAWTRP